MNVQLPDDILHRAEAGALEVRLAVAIQFYTDNRLDFADACRLAGLRSQVFSRELLSRGLSIQQYGVHRSPAEKRRNAV